MKSVKRYIAIASTIFMLVGSSLTNTTVLAASGDTPVVITATGKCYHNPGCRTLKKTRIDTTMQDAVNKGLKECQVCTPGTIDGTTTTNITNTGTATTTTASTAIEALKTYKGNTTEFNAYAYYINNVDLQTAIGADGDKLLKHYNDFGKAEGRIAQ